jgi:DNA-binding NtrC family response regulator
LNVLSIRVPALRDRREDIAPLARRFAADVSAELGLETRDLCAGALEQLARHAWPGNVRELRNVIERARSSNRAARRSRSNISVSRMPSRPLPFPRAVSCSTSPDRSLKSVERALIERVLTETSGNRSAAARVLGVNRATLYNKLRVYGLPA